MFFCRTCSFYCSSLRLRGENEKKEQHMSYRVILKKNATWRNNIIVDRNFNCCKIHSSILFYKCWYYNTDIHKNKKQQFRSKKSLNEINLYFDAFFSGICVFAVLKEMKQVVFYFQQKWSTPSYHWLENNFGAQNEQKVLLVMKSKDG